jgi:hypothetical protein
MSMCLLRLKSPWPCTHPIAPVFSWHMTVGRSCLYPNSSMRLLSQVISRAKSEQLTYSASVEDSDMVLCLTLFHPIVAPPTVMTCPFADDLPEFPAQSASACPTNTVLVGLRRSSQFLLPCRYLRSRFMAIQSMGSGSATGRLEMPTVPAMSSRVRVLRNYTCPSASRYS